MRLLAAAFVALLALPVAQAQAGSSTPTPLYFHIFDTLTPFPVNTQAPDTSFFKVGGTSFPTIASQGYQFNRIRGFSTSGPVEYGFIEAGRPRFHLEPGIAREVQLDRAAGARVVLYLDVRDFVGLQAAPNALPSLTFDVAVREGNLLGSDEVLDAGRLLLHGRRTAHVLDLSACSTGPVDPGAPLPPIPLPEGCNELNTQVGNQTLPNGDLVVVPAADGVAAFTIPLEFDADAIPKAGYNVRIDWWQNPTGDASQDDQYATGFLRFVADGAHRPRLELATKNPIYVEYLHPEVAAGILLIHSCINSPWGTYDIDIGNTTVLVNGPVLPQKLQQVVSQNAHVHQLHDKCAEVTWLWRFRAEQAPEGDYAIRLTVPNLAGSAKATETARFTIDAERAYGIDEKGNEVTQAFTADTEKSPAAGPLLALAFLGLAALARRRSA